MLIQPLTEYSSDKNGPVKVNVFSFQKQKMKLRPITAKKEKF